MYLGAPICCAVWTLILYGVAVAAPPAAPCEEDLKFIDPGPIRARRRDGQVITLLDPSMGWPAPGFLLFRASMDQGSGTQLEPDGGYGSWCHAMRDLRETFLRGAITWPRMAVMLRGIAVASRAHAHARRHNSLSLPTAQ